MIRLIHSIRFILFTHNNPLPYDTSFTPGHRQRLSQLVPIACCGLVSSCFWGLLPTVSNEIMPGTTEGVSLGAAATAAIAGGVYFAKNGEFPSGKSGDGAQGIAERIASITDEEIAHVFGEKVDEIEAAVKEVATDGYNYIAHHKPLAVVVAVLSAVVILIGILALRRNQTKGASSTVENRTSDAAANADAAVDKADPATLASAEEEEASVSTPPNGEDAALTDDVSAGVVSLDDQEQEAVASVTPSDTAAVGGGEARPKMKFRSPVKRGKIRSPVRRGKRE